MAKSIIFFVVFSVDFSSKDCTVDNMHVQPNLDAQKVRIINYYSYLLLTSSDDDDTLFIHPIICPNSYCPAIMNLL
jgi:hypothetical protein